MSAHTPGPWINVDGRMFPVCDIMTGAPVATVHKRRKSGQCEANASLIAAAPALLAALRYIEGVAMAGEPRDLPGIVQKARAAIAKAEGKQ